MEIKLVKDILQANNVIAAQNRERFTAQGTYVINLMGGPGAGKTTLLERTIERLHGRRRLAVIEGDIATARDAERIAAHGTPVVQINTGGECHLDGNMVRGGLEQVDLAGVDLLVIENVGNLVCPAEFNVGEDVKIMVSSVTEGDDKPLKYPLMFQVSTVLLLNKIDLLPHVAFDVERFQADARKVNPHLEIMPLSCTTGEGLDTWIHWLEERTKTARK